MDIRDDDKVVATLKVYVGRHFDCEDVFVAVYIEAKRNKLRFVDGCVFVRAIECLKEIDLIISRVREVVCSKIDFVALCARIREHAHVVEVHVFYDSKRILVGVFDLNIRISCNRFSENDVLVTEWARVNRVCERELSGGFTRAKAGCRKA